LVTPVINSHGEADNEINSNEIEKHHQRDSFLHVKDEICESSDNIPKVGHCNVYDEANNTFKNFSNIQVYNSDEDNNSNLSAFINSQTRIKI
jgi:hypothetical protein